MDIYTITIVAGAAVSGCVVTLLIKAALGSKKLKDAQTEAEKIVITAKTEAEGLIKEAGIEAKDILFKMKSDFESEAKETRLEFKKAEHRLIQKEENIDRKTETIEKREKEITLKEQTLSDRDKTLAHKEEKYNTLLSEQKTQLEKISTLTADQAKELLIRAMENEARYEGAKLIKRIENEANEAADKKAKRIIATAIQRYAGDFVAERTVSVVQLPGDEMKGRIIGREGRNIRAIEAATGIDLIIDDTPEAVILSGFNPVRREVARLALIKLI